MDDYAAIYAIYADDSHGSAASKSRFSKIIPKNIALSSFVVMAAGLEIGLLVVLAWFFGHHPFNAMPEPLGLLALAAAVLVQMFLCTRLSLYAVEAIADYRMFISKFLLVIAATVCMAMTIMAMSEKTHELAVILPKLLAVAATSFILFACLRYLICRVFQLCVDQRIIHHAVVLVGVSDNTQKFIEHVHSLPFGITIRAIYDDAQQAAGRVIAGVPVAGNIADLLSYHRRFSIHQVVITAPPAAPGAFTALLARLSMQPLAVRLLPDSFSCTQRSRQCARLGEIPGVELVTVLDPPITWFSRMVKDGFDRLAALAAIVIFGPVLILCAVCIKLSSKGPVFYRQKRIGYRNRGFYVFKFRSMHLESCDMLRLTVRDDPRVFRFGKIMRKLSLDELPQLFNVLRGEMSLVGPRPHMFEARAGAQLYFDVVPHYAARHRVKPGITGWAQVNGWRGPTETAEAIEKRVAHDLHYIANWSFILDLKILVKTALGGFFGKNAF